MRNSFGTDVNCKDSSGHLFQLFWTLLPRFPLLISHSLLVSSGPACNYNYLGWFTVRALCKWCFHCSCWFLSFLISPTFYLIEFYHCGDFRGFTLIDFLQNVNELEEPGYVHQCDHAATRLQAETVCLDFTVCGSEQLVVNDQHTTRHCKQWPSSLSTVLTLSKDVLHHHHELAGTDLHVLGERRRSDITLRFPHFKHQLSALFTYLTSDLLINGSKLFLLLSFLHRLK